MSWARPGRKRRSAGRWPPSRGRSTPSRSEPAPASAATPPPPGTNPRRGQLAYLSATLRGLVRYRPVACRVEVDGEELYDGEFFLAAVANGRFFGNGMKVAPEARLDDGLLDVVVIPPVPLWHLPYRMPQFLSGRHLKLPIVRFRKARRVRFEPREGFPPYEVDGEILPSGPAEIRVTPGALRVLA